MLTAEIIAIGSELLAPTRTDTNSLWLTEQLNRIGIDVKLKTIVGDDDVRLEEAIKDAVKRSRVVITTGGLGPTEDDVTRKVAARALGRRLVLNESVLREIRDRFAQYKMTMPERNSRQAMVIDGADVLDNPNGSAPGLYLEHEGCAIALLPGPPREMQPMFESFVRPRLAEKSGDVRFARRVLRVAGMGESAIDEKIAPIYTRYENPQTTILFNSSEVEIHLSAHGRSEAEAETLLDDLSEKIEDKLGNSIFAFRGETMEQVVGLKLSVGGFTVAVAESCTGGLIAQRLTDVPGSSKYFVEGVVTYSNASKTRLLGVDPKTNPRRGRGQCFGGRGNGRRSSRACGNRFWIGGHGHRRARRRHRGKAGGLGVHRPRRRRAHGASPADVAWRSSSRPLACFAGGARSFETQVNLSW